MLDMPYANQTFDVVIEKGTMDVLFVDNNQPFDPKAEVKHRVFKMLDETHRYKLAPHNQVCFAVAYFGQIIVNIALSHACHLQ